MYNHLHSKITGLTLIMILVCSMEAGARQAVPDIVLLNGKIFTADRANPWVEALAIQGDHITSTGTTSEIERLAGSDTRRIDLKGRVAIPGINDAHIHSGWRIPGVQIRTSGLNAPMPEILDSLHAAASRNEPGTWLYVSVDPQIFKDSLATRFAIDRIIAQHPVSIISFTGHGHLLNSSALQVLGIDEYEPDPFGGWYDRTDDDSNRITGLLHGYANFNARIQMAQSATDTFAVAGLRNFASAMVRFGITSVQDMPVAGTERTMKWLREANVLVRWRLIHFPGTTPDGRLSTITADNGITPSPMISLSGVKWVAEGTPIEHGTLLRSAYSDRPDWHGLTYFEPDLVRTFINEAYTNSGQMLLHASGDSLLANIFSDMEATAPDSTWQRLRLRIEHGDGLMPDQLDIAKRLGVIIVQNPIHFNDPETMQSRMGERVNSYQLLSSLLEAGVHVALGSDGPINPYLNIMFAVTHPVNPGEALSREQAVIAYTLGSAFAEFAEHEKGLIKEGYLADIAVLSQDIFSVPVDALPATESVLTLVGGRVVYEGLIDE